MPEKPEGTIKYGKFRETGNIGYTRLRKTQPAVIDVRRVFSPMKMNCSYGHHFECGDTMIL
jgi:hypothetical protein